MTQKESGWHFGEQSEDSSPNPITPAKKRGSEEPSDQPTKRPSPKSDEKKVPSPLARKGKESEEMETVSQDPAEEGQGGKGKQKVEGEIEQLKQKSELKEKGKKSKEKEIDEIWKEYNGSFLRDWFGEDTLSPLNKLKLDEDPDKEGKKRSVEDILQEKVWIPATKHLKDHYQLQEREPLKREFLFKYCLEEALKATLKKPEKKELLFTSSYTAVTHETVAKSFCDPVLIRGIERKDDVITIELSFLQKNEVTTQKIKLIKSENHHRLSCNCEEFEKKRKRNKKDGPAPPTPHFCRHAYLVSRCIFSGNPTTEEYWRLEVDPEKEKKPFDHARQEEIELQGAYLCPVCGDAFHPETVEHKDMLRCGSFRCNFPLLTTKRLKAKIDKDAATSSALMSQENLTLKELSLGVDENSNEAKKISSQELGQLEQDGAGQYSTWRGAFEPPELEKSVASSSKVSPQILESVVHSEHQPNKPKCIPFDACKQGLLAEIEPLLKDPRVDVNQPDKDDYTPLWIICQNNHLPCAKALFASGRAIDVKRKSEGDGSCTAAEIARKQNHTELANFVDAYEEDPEAVIRELRKELGMKETALEKSLGTILSSCSRSIPEDFPELGEILELTLVDCVALRNFPQDIRKMKKLKKLALERNLNLTLSPNDTDVLWSLPSLIDMDIDQNFQNLSPGGIEPHHLPIRTKPGEEESIKPENDQEIKRDQLLHDYDINFVDVSAGIVCSRNVLDLEQEEQVRELFKLVPETSFIQDNHVSELLPLMGIDPRTPEAQGSPHLKIYRHSNSAGRFSTATACLVTRNHPLTSGHFVAFNEDQWQSAPEKIWPLCKPEPQERIHSWKYDSEDDFLQVKADKLSWSGLGCNICDSVESGQRVMMWSAMTGRMLQGRVESCDYLVRGYIQFTYGLQRVVWAKTIAVQWDEDQQPQGGDSGSPLFSSQGVVGMLRGCEVRMEDGTISPRSFFSRIPSVVERQKINVPFCLGLQCSELSATAKTQTINWMTQQGN